MKDLGKYLLVYLLGCTFVFTAILGYSNASNRKYQSIKKELPITARGNSNKFK